MPVRGRVGRVGRTVCSTAQATCIDQNGAITTAEHGAIANASVVAAACDFRDGRFARAPALSAILHASVAIASVATSVNAHLGSHAAGKSR